LSDDDLEDTTRAVHKSKAVGISCSYQRPPTAVYGELL